MNYDKLDLLTPEEIEIRKYKAAHPLSTRKTMGAPIVAKGDSWFDFPPGLDLVDSLRELGFTINNFSRAGDTLENMIHGNSVDDDGKHLPPGIDAALLEVKRARPGYFLFSGGGNDVAGQEFVNFLNHSRQGSGKLLRESIAEEMINVVFKDYLVHLIKVVKSACPTTKIVMHGYGHALPSGKATKILFIPVAGPWLLPGLQKKAISQAVGEKLIVDLIDRYNEMLRSLAVDNSNFLYVDIRSSISANDWRDELHLKSSAYARVAAKIAKVIEM
ncbi:SGNH/GDSL hydrolase family protein [Hydrogenophaga sp.]|uniref:SGNH/GDSL hydrolase family protein n=1 Tax=Hydrogenophaga sp. TaxID=1904254 RepID=UPI00272F8839|nr:SGNH/GDSL hydrolase family protein [Hydrogenophaga sp.]MDP2075153.1 hypothetical protein [Hydrogenophaga sp.]MDP3108410.1 hypothetical protein [Hydrogenophaga sp.]